MGWAFDIGKVFGIRLRVHYVFLLLLLIIGWLATNHHGLAAGLTSVLYICSVFFFVVLHELGHSLVAMRFGVRVEDIVLLPIGGVARMDRIPESPIQEILIAIAGPTVNFICAALLLPIIFVFGLTAVVLLPATISVASFLGSLLMINLIMGIFNLIPAFPLDGGRIARALLAFRLPYVTATAYAARLGRFIALAFCVISLVGGTIWFLLLAIFIYIAGKQEELYVRAREFERRFVRPSPLQSQVIYYDPYSMEETMRRIETMLHRIPHGQHRYPDEFED